MEGPQKEKIIRAFGRNLKKMRLEKGLSLRELATEADMEHKHIDLLEKGISGPTLPTLYALAEALQIDPRELLP